jgi:IPT/TIG domain
VFFGGVPAASKQFISASLIRATTPAHAGGTVGVQVICGNDTATLDNAFTFISVGPTVSSVLPQSGSTGGGTLVRINGTNFDSSCWPSFGDKAANEATFVSATELIAETPAHAAGEVDVLVQCTGGSSMPARLFTYVNTEPAAPSLLAVSPTSAASGELVTIVGLGFRRDDVVEIGGAVAAIVETKPDALVVRVPELPLGKTNIDVVEAKQRRITLGPIFTVLEAQAPRISSVSPATVPAGGEVLLTGTGFRAGYSFRIGGRTATVLWRTLTATRIRVAHDTPAGSHTVDVITPAGQLSSIGPALDVTAAGLLLRGITPNCATTDGLADVTIHGTGFTNGMQVRFGEALATNVTLLDATTLRVRVPAGRAGLTTIAATAGNATATLTNGFEYNSPFDPNGGCSGRRSRGARH